MASRKIRRWILRKQDYDFDILFAMSSIAAFPQQKLVFNRIKKSGNTSVVTFLHELDGKKATGSTNDIKSQQTHMRRLTLLDTYRFPTFYSFAVIRNPYSRLLSGFLHRIAPAHLPEYSDIPGFGESSPTGFGKFVDFLCNGHVDFDKHFWPQTRLMYQSPDRFNRLVRLEHLVDDMADLLDDLGKPRNLAEKLRKPHRIEQSQTNKITNAHTQLDAFYSEDIKAKAAQLYRNDLAALPVAGPWV